jgi:multiple sugar transport system substrate-binding protein
MPDKWQALYAGAGKLVNLEDKIKGWKHGSTLTDKTMAMARQGEGIAYSIPYGFYLRAMFYNKKLLKEAGVANPPVTMAEFKEASAKVSKLDGKYGYCLRGGVGGLGGWMMSAAATLGSSKFFDENGKATINQPEAVKGLQYMIDIYQDGSAPKDSVNWGFNEIVAGFYSGTCAFLDQDPDALPAVIERMPAEDFAVIPMPVGMAGKAYPTIGFAGWSIFNTTKHEKESWGLLAHLSSPENNKTWARKVGVIPVHAGAEQDPYYKTEQFAGWFEELNSEKYEPLILPTYLEGFGYFGSTLALESSQQALLGEITAQEMADQWAEYLSDEYAKWKAKQ